MTDYKAPLDDIRFVMKDVFDVQSLWQSLEGLEDADEETADAVLEEAAKVCEQEIAPLDREADEQGCRWEDHKVISPKGYKEAYQTFCEGGWGGLAGDPEYGGMGMPKTLVAAIEEMVQGACISFGLAPMLTAGACLAIRAHASEELKQRYLPKMYSGEWSGAMDLTEPHCGTDLGLIRTKAEPLDDGSYSINGTKIFITWGDQDMSENVIHLVLAKLPDAPAGSRGISLFLVPKTLVSESGELEGANGVSCGSLEKKMGIKGSATCVMNYDNAKGWLVGEPNKGLACMFTMMNYERLVVGIQGMGVAENSYQGAVNYARERIQGRSPTGVKQPEIEADTLLVHPDVRRMLMTMRAWNEGGRAFYTYVGQFLDIAKYAVEPERKEHANNMVALLTPVAKAFLTDRAFDTTVIGQQVLGGHGYIREWGQEQKVRDTRITQIYEGTNGIQAMDLIGRKTVGSKGLLTNVFITDVEEYIASTEGLEGRGEFIPDLVNALDVLKSATSKVVENSAQDPCAPGAAAVDYLNLLGYVAYAYMWARMAMTLIKQNRDDDFAKAKLSTASFFFKKLLPQIQAYEASINAGSDTVMSMDDSWF